MTNERQADEAEGAAGHSRRAPESRRYDSFVVRVWRAPGSERLLRADVRHVQSGASESAIDCDPGWIGMKLAATLDEDREA